MNPFRNAWVNRLMDQVYPPMVRRIGGAERKLYLTFDDGPVPEVTTKVLDILSNYHVSATFFCLGNAVESNPGIYRKIKALGHLTGNHSYSHPDGFCSATASYLADIQRASSLIQSPLFRPPYGRIYPWQALRLSTSYAIILWDLMCTDYRRNTSPERALKLLITGTRSGSVVVMHDSAKAAPVILKILPAYLDHCLQAGYEFSPLTAF